MPIISAVAAGLIQYVALGAVATIFRFTLPLLIIETFCEANDQEPLTVAQSLLVRAAVALL